MGAKLWCVASAVVLLSCGGEEFSAGAGGNTSGGSGGNPTGGTAGVSSGGSGGSAGTVTGGTAGSAGSGAAGGVAGSGASGSCLGECLAIPNEWEGPVVVAPTCNGDYPAKVKDALSGLNAPNPCSCQCNSPVCNAQVQLHKGDNCGTQIVQNQITNTCLSSNVEEVGSVRVTPSGTCGSLTPTPPAPQWDTYLSLCASAAKGGCPTGQGCGPAAPPPRCVHRPGSHSCPSAFPQQSIYHTGLNDTRVCSPCVCTPKCNMEVGFFLTTNCSTMMFSCQALSASKCCLRPPGSDQPVLGTRMISSNFVGEDCTGGIASGSATPTGTYTVCCEG